MADTPSQSRYSADEFVRQIALEIPRVEDSIHGPRLRCRHCLHAWPDTAPADHAENCVYVRAAYVRSEQQRIDFEEASRDHRDAERYRWLRDCEPAEDTGIALIFSSSTFDPCPGTPAEIDGAIDAAMSNER